MKESDLKIYNEGIKEGLKHARSSAETRVMYQKMEKRFAKFDEKNEKCHADIKERVVSVEKQIIELRGDLNPIKRIMWLVLTILITTVGGAILALVVIK